MCNLYSDLTAPNWIKAHIELPSDLDTNRLFNQGAIYIERAAR